MNSSSKFKIALSVAVIVVALVAVIAVCSVQHDAKVEFSNGVILDFSEYDTVWTGTSLEGVSAIDALKTVCEKNRFSCRISESGIVEEINGIPNTEDRRWDLWIIEKGGTIWKKMESPYTYGVSGKAAVCWAYRTSNEKPTVAVDVNGISIYGIGKVSRTVTLSASLTEDLCSVGAIDTIVGTDKFSNYPKAIVDGHNSGRIAIVGDYATPNFEAIIKQNPDAVFCDDSVSNHAEVCERLKNSGVKAFLLYKAYSAKEIMDNIFAVAQISGHRSDMKVLFDKMDNIGGTIASMLSKSPKTKVCDIAVTLSGDMSPYVSGSNTYIDSIVSALYGVNVFRDMDGWVSVNSEQILKRNPSKIIVLSSSIEATEESYNRFISSLPAEWKGTNAYKNGEIYLFCDGANDLAQRPGPRFIQLAELVAKIINPDVFPDSQVRKYIGNDYRDFLVYSKEMGI